MEIKTDATMNTLTLKCPSCGAALEVAPDMDRFACGFCGTEQLVERRGGTVALKLVSEAIARVQSGTDRTAAELAIRRLSEELGALKMRKNEIATLLDERENTKNKASGEGIVCCVCAIGTGTICGSFIETTGVILFVLLTIVFSFFAFVRFLTAFFVSEPIRRLKEKSIEIALRQTNLQSQLAKYLAQVEI